MTPSAPTRRLAWVDDVLEDLGRVAQGRDPGGDLAQGLLRVGPAGQSASRDRSSSSMSRAFVIAMAAWAAIASRSAASASAQASRRLVKTVSAAERTPSRRSAARP